jgi:hypothetical protein
MTLGKTFAEKQREQKGDEYDYVVAKLKRRIAELEAENRRLRDQFRHVDELDWRWIDELLALSSSGNAPFWRHVLRDARAALKGDET